MSAVPGWFVVNVREAPTVQHPLAGQWMKLEPEGEPFPEIGINVRVLQPGDVSGLYHAENAQEDFLVLSGTCLALVGGEERELHQWDLLHVSPGVSHTIVGAGEGPCAVLMIGARHPDHRTYYPESELAARHRASSPVSTESAAEAYAEWADLRFEDVTPTWPPTPTD